MEIELMFITISLESYDFTNVRVKYTVLNFYKVTPTHASRANLNSAWWCDEYVRFILVFTMKIHNSTLNTDMYSQN